MRQQPAQFVQPLKPCVRGHFAPLYEKFNQCTECVRENNTRSRERNKESRQRSSKRWQLDNRGYVNEQRVRYNTENPARRMVNAAKKSAKNKSIPFDLLWSDIAIPQICPVLGIALKVSLGARTDSSPSLDRIIPELGYVKGNIIVISWRANRLKQDATLDELVAVAGFYQKLASKD